MYVKYESSTYSGSWVIGKVKVFVHAHTDAEVRQQLTGLSSCELKMTSHVILPSISPCVISMQLGKKIGWLMTLGE